MMEFKTNIVSLVKYKEFSLFQTCNAYHCVIIDSYIAIVICLFFLWFGIELGRWRERNREQIKEIKKEVFKKDDKE